MRWFIHQVWPNLFASIVWSLPTWAFIFWRFARRFMREREEILHRLDEMHRNMNEQHRATHQEHTEIREEVHRAPPPPPKTRRLRT